MQNHLEISHVTVEKALLSIEWGIRETNYINITKLQIKLDILQTGLFCWSDYFLKMPNVFGSSLAIANWCNS